MELVGFVGMALVIVGGLWMWARAFGTSLLWGVGFIFPLVPLFFLVMHWHEAKKPWLTALAGGALVLLAG